MIKKLKIYTVYQIEYSDEYNIDYTSDNVIMHHFADYNEATLAFNTFNEFNLLREEKSQFRFEENWVCFDESVLK